MTRSNLIRSRAKIAKQISDTEEIVNKIKSVYTCGRKAQRGRTLKWADAIRTIDIRRLIARVKTRLRYRALIRK